MAWWYHEYAPDDERAFYKGGEGKVGVTRVAGSLGQRAAVVVAKVALMAASLLAAGQFAQEVADTIFCSLDRGSWLVSEKLAPPTSSRGFELRHGNRDSLVGS